MDHNDLAASQQHWSTHIVRIVDHHEIVPGSYPDKMKKECNSKKDECKILPIEIPPEWNVGSNRPVGENIGSYAYGTDIWHPEFAGSCSSLITREISGGKGNMNNGGKF